MANTLYTGDNLYILNGMNSESVDLIYLDPPFNSKRLYFGTKNSTAADAKFKDIWEWTDVDKDRECLDSLCEHPDLLEYLATIKYIHGKEMMAYCTYMTMRIIQLHRVLKSTGGLYLHCDQTASHYLKIVMDKIFGKDGFKNEIIWSYRTGGASKQHWSRKHDTILFYAKPKYKHKAMKERIHYAKPFFSSKVDKDGKHYADVYIRDVWEDVKPLINLSKERTGYPTQKPLSLLYRIIEASSKKGDIVLDPFCGCATTCEAAERLERKWIGIDIESSAGDLLANRLNGTKTGQDFVRCDKIPQRTDVEEIDPSEATQVQLIKQKSNHCNGCGKKLSTSPAHIKLIVPKDKGGGDYYENLHLLCGSCLKATNELTMESLIKRARKRKPAGKFL